MTEVPPRLELLVDAERDHIQGPVDAPVSLVQYGDYSCSYCQQLYPILQELRNRFGEQYRFVYRHFPTTPRAKLAAEAAEAAGAQGKFWEMHDCLHSLGPVDVISREQLFACAADIGLDQTQFEQDLDEHRFAAKVERDFKSGRESGVLGTPTLFVSGVRYDGPWDLEALTRAIEQPLGTQVRNLFNEFLRLEASGGLLLLGCAILALLLSNSAWSASYADFRDTTIGIQLGEWEISKHLLHWVNEGLMVLFFFVVGLEIKREVLAGELSETRRAILPVAGALGGMILPAIIYLALNWGGTGEPGWGIPVATDIAFLIGILAMLGSRVPTSLKVLFTALAIADDIGAVLVIAVFYSSNIQWSALGIGLVLLVGLILLNRLKIYRPSAYALLGVGLWLAFLESGVHPTLAGVLVAMTIPANVTMNITAFTAQTMAMLAHLEPLDPRQERSNVVGRRQALAQELEIIAERIESPLQRLERGLHPWTTYLVIPLFALVNAGVEVPATITDTLTDPVSLGIILGLVIGKPVGITALSWLATRVGLAELPSDLEWSQVFGASFLAGIGFTMSLFIAGAGFTDPEQLDTAKLGILVASVLAGLIGTGLLSLTSSVYERRTEFKAAESAA